MLSTGQYTCHAFLIVIGPSINIQKPEEGYALKNQSSNSNDHCTNMNTWLFFANSTQRTYEKTHLGQKQMNMLFLFLRTLNCSKEVGYSLSYTLCCDTIELNVDTKLILDVMGFNVKPLEWFCWKNTFWQARTCKRWTQKCLLPHLIFHPELI